MFKYILKLLEYTVLPVCRRAGKLLVYLPFSIAIYINVFVLNKYVRFMCLNISSNYLNIRCYQFTDGGPLCSRAKAHFLKDPGILCPQVQQSSTSMYVRPLCDVLSTVKALDFCFIRRARTSVWILTIYVYFVNKIYFSQGPHSPKYNFKLNEQEK